MFPWKNNDRRPAPFISCPAIAAFELIGSDLDSMPQRLHRKNRLRALRQRYQKSPEQFQFSLVRAYR